MLIFEPAICPQVYQSPREFKANVRRAEFEGGYSQRSRVGPNSIGRTVPVQWEVPETVRNYIEAFFRARGGAEGFLYQLPLDPAPVVWTVEAWTSVPIGIQGQEMFWRISTTLRQEFDIL